MSMWTPSPGVMKESTYNFFVVKIGAENIYFISVNKQKRNAFILNDTKLAQHYVFARGRSQFSVCTTHHNTLTYFVFW